MSSRQFIHNNIASTLNAAILGADTSFDVVDPIFPAVTAPDFYHATLESVDASKVEIVKVTNVVGTTLFVERGQDGTSGLDFALGDRVQIRTTRGLLDRLGQKSDLGAMYPFQTTVVTGILQLYIDPTGSDVTGDGSVGAPWASPYKALEELQYLRFGITGNAVINCAAGTYAMDAQLLVNHPQGERISFTSSATFQAVTGMPIGDYSVDRNAPVVPTRQATEFHNTAGTLGVNATAPTRATSRSNDRTNNRLLFEGINGCIFKWASAGADESKFLITTRLGGLTNIVLVFPTSDGTDQRHGVHLVPGATFTAADLQVFGASRGVWINEGQLSCSNIAVAGSGSCCICVENAGVLSCDTLRLQGSISGDNLDVLSGGVVEVNTEFVSSGALRNGVEVLSNSSIRVDGSVFTCSGNEIYGVGVEASGNVTFKEGGAGAIIVSGNVSNGFTLSRASSADAYGLSCIGNGGSGVICSDNSMIRVRAGTGKSNNNGSYGIACTGGGVYTCQIQVCDGNVNAGLFGLDGGKFDGNDLTCVNSVVGQAILASYSGPLIAANATIDLSNAAAIDVEAIGGSVVRCPAPGDGGVNAGVVMSPTHGVAGADTSIITDITT